MGLLKTITKRSKNGRDEYDDQALVDITNSFLSEYDLLVDRASSFKPPQKYPGSTRSVHKKFEF